MTDAASRARWMAAHIALRLALEYFTGKDFARQPLLRMPQGRPYLPPPAPSFSLSHAGWLGLIVIADAGPVGADIEEIAPRAIAPARRAGLEALAVELAAGEALPQNAPGSHARFIQAWCRIEAYAKAEGCGVGRLLTRAGLLGTRNSSSTGEETFAPDVPTAAPSLPRASGRPGPAAGGLRAWDVQLAGGIGQAFAAALAGPPHVAGLGAAIVPRPGTDLLPPPG